MPREDTEWTIVRGKKRKKYKQRQPIEKGHTSRQHQRARIGATNGLNIEPNLCTSSSTPEDRERRVHAVLSLIEDTVQEISRSNYYNRLKARMQDLEFKPSYCPKSLCTLGLGSLEQPGGVHIRYQLGLAVALIRDFPYLQEADRPWAFDPVWTEVDRIALKALQISPLATIAESDARMVAKETTLFYMPHCEVDLTCSLLKCNEDAGTLHNVIVYGNSFESYADRFNMKGHPADNTHLQYLSHLVASGACTEIKLKDDFDVAGAFNDLSLHVFTATE